MIKGQKRRSFTDEFKQAAVNRIRAGESLQKVSEDIKVVHSVVRRWREEFQASAAKVALDFDSKTKKVKANGASPQVHDAIVFLRKARKAMEKRGVVAAFDDPVCQFAMLALNTLEGKI